MTVIEPTAGAFFATATGVCVYVSVRHRSVRIQFESPDAPARVEGTSDAEAEIALLAATRAFEKYKPQLEPLFEHVALELAARQGAPDAQYLPTACDDCHRVEPLLPEHCAGGEAVCPDCGGIARVLPGAVYRGADLAVFRQLSAIVARAGVRGPEALRLQIDIERACAIGAELEAFTDLVRRLPSLEPVRLMLEASPHRRRRTLTMLGTLLNAMASKYRSGTMLALNLPAGRPRVSKG